MLSTCEWTETDCPSVQLLNQQEASSVSRLVASPSRGCRSVARYWSIIVGSIAAVRCVLTLVAFCFA